MCPGVFDNLKKTGGRLSTRASPRKPEKTAGKWGKSRCHSARILPLFDAERAARPRSGVSDAVTSSTDRLNIEIVVRIFIIWSYVIASQVPPQSFSTRKFGHAIFAFPDPADAQIDVRARSGRKRSQIDRPKWNAESAARRHAGPLACRPSCRHDRSEHDQENFDFSRCRC